MTEPAERSAARLSHQHITCEEATQTLPYSFAAELHHFWRGSSGLSWSYADARAKPSAFGLEHLHQRKLLQSNS